MAQAIREGRCSVDYLLKAYDWLAIPHFQRGLVWDPGSVALLLESLYFGTPCGSVLLWKPDDPKRHGVALGTDPKYLVIDGQQRIRSLHGVFGDDDTDRAGEMGAGDESQEPSTDEDRPDAVPDVWCLNLAQLPNRASSSEGRGRFRLFGLHRNPLTPVEADAGRPDLKQRQELLPLKWFLDRDPERDRLVQESRGTTAARAVTKVLRSADAALARRFEQDLPRIETRISKGALTCPVDTRNQAGVRCAVKVLEWLSSRLSRSGRARG